MSFKGKQILWRQKYEQKTLPTLVWIKHAQSIFKLGGRKA
jgi:hypothetical protein